MRSLLEWWSDVVSLLSDPQIVMVTTAVLAVLAVAGLILYAIWRWRVEKAFVEEGLRDAIARIHRYASCCPESDSSNIGDRRREYLSGAMARWLSLCHARWTDFQVFLALRALRKIQPGSRWIAQLGAGFTEALLETANPRMNLVSAVINNALATALGMRPGSARVPMALSDDPAAATAGAADGLDLSSISDPFVVEDDVAAALEERGPDWLHRLLNTTQRANAHRRLAPRDEEAKAIMAEAVVWIVHEERIGQALLSRELLRIYEVSWQLLEHVPGWLRESAVSAVHHLGASQLAIILTGVRLPRATQFGGFAFPAELDTDRELWHYSRVEFDVANETARLVFEAR